MKGLLLVWWFADTHGQLALREQRYRRRAGRQARELRLRARLHECFQRRERLLRRP